jgi:hypothetical protein
MRLMRRALVLAAVGVTALAAAGGGGARATKVVQLDAGDSFTVAGSHVPCVIRKKLVTCGLFKRSKLVAGTYAVTLTGEGEALLAKIKHDGTPVPIEHRKPSVLRRSYVLHAKDVAYVLGTKIYCLVSPKPSAGVLCAQYDIVRRRYTPGSYEVAITDRDASLGRFSPAGKLKVIKFALQPPL